MQNIATVFVSDRMPGRLPLRATVAVTERFGKEMADSSRTRAWSGALYLFFVSLLLVLAPWLPVAKAQQVERSLPLSQRATINLSAGVPQYIGDATSTSSAPQRPWLYENTANSTQYATQTFVEDTDSAAHWQPVGVPYDANIPRTFINQTSGGGDGSLTGNQNWYRLHFKVDSKYAGQKFLLNLEGSHTAVQVFINGSLLPGISLVTANAKATHVVGFIPVVVDLTPYIRADGTTDNVIAIDVSRGDPWFEQPGFSGAFRFGQAMAGLFRNVYLYVTNPVHIPVNVYSNQKTWGTYVGTKSIDYSSAATETANSAQVEVQTNVLNESNATQQVTLTTQIVDASGKVVVTAPPLTQTVAPMTAATFPSGPAPMFDQTITVPNPTLWYPNNSIYGKPYMYKVYHIVSVNGVVVDSAQSPLGIRMLTWDKNFPYFNGHQQYLWGASGRYDYPGLGSAVPDEQVWRDLAQFAAGGGNVWRPGHSTSSEEFVEAADAYGIMIDQPSGDGEGHWSLSSNTPPTADDLQLKQELHRDMIIRDRSHPSILDWEEDNGGNNTTLAAQLDTLEQQWDSIQIRKQATRSGDTSYAYINECDQAGCEIASKQNNEDFPSFGAEYWDNVGTGRGLAYDNELSFAAPYLDDWRRGRAVNTFGMAQWYFADTPGEISLWSEYQKNPAMINFVRSLGYSEVDQNRFPRLLYYIYQANWVPYSIQPVVALAHHWNRAYEYTQGTPIQVNAFSNCPTVRLLINGVAKDPVTGALLADQKPNDWNGNSSADLTQNTTVMPGQVHWMTNFAPGNVTAQCIDQTGNPGVSDTRVTAGPEYRIVLTAVPELQKPDGTSFQWTSNGSDAAFVTAEVVDQQGNIVPTAADNVTFSVSGPAQYMGGTQQLVADPSWTNYYQDAFSLANAGVIGGQPNAFFHAPGDPELNFEGGLQKIALRSTFTPGTVTVTATAPGLVGDSVTLTSVAPPPPVTTQAPAIIVPPVSTAVTQGQPATFTVSASGSGTLNYQWYLNNNQVAGATGTTFTTAATTLADNNDSIIVTVTSAGGFGSVSSNPAILSVFGPEKVAITTSPASLTSVVGQTATFSVVASGSPQLTYTWFKNGNQLVSGSQSSYTTPILTTAETDTYYVIVSNPLNQVQSENAVLTVATPVPVSITGSPVSQIVASNQPVVLSATVAGSSPYIYQWNFTPRGGATTILESNTQSSNVFNFTIPAMSASNAGAYTITVNNAANAPATSASAQLTLAPPGVNLAYAMPATASSSQQNCNDLTTAPPLTGVNCLGAENAVDGNLATRWASASAGAPPAIPTPGVDPSDLIIDLGSTQPFNTVAINWENAYATDYEIDYTNDDPTANPQWVQAIAKHDGGGSSETLNFGTVHGRYVRMHAIQRATQYGYSILEFQVYNLAQCGGVDERYTPSTTDTSLVVDNLLNLTWTRTVQTDATTGAQFTGDRAAAFCATRNMRLPTRAEALSISGNNYASCAFNGTWSTWTSTVNPVDSTETAIVSFNGNVTQNVTNNFPGATLCTTGTFAGQTPLITSAPQPALVKLGQSATFRVTATGVPSPTYQWSKGGTVIPAATEPTYITPPTTANDNGATFSVAVTNGSGTVASTPVALTISSTPLPPPIGPTGPTTPNDPGAVTAPAGSAINPTNPVIPADPANSGNGNTSSTNTMIAGYGSTPAPAGPNLALGGAALSTGNENDGLGPINAVDGVAATRWSSAFNNASDMQVDLGSVKSVGQVLLRWERSYGYQYQIRVSIDGQSWTPVFTQTQGQGGTENLLFPAVNARYVQFHGIQRSSQYGYSLWEMEVYGPLLPTITTQPVDQTVTAGSQAQFSVVAGGTGPFTYQWQLNGTPIAGANSATYTTGVLSSADSNGVFNVIVTNAGGSTSSSNAKLIVTNPAPSIVNLALFKPTTSSGDENANLAPLNATDGNLNTRWSSAADDKAYLQVDLGASMLVNKVVLYWEAAYGAAYEIQVSNDLQTWTTVRTQSAGQGGVESLTFPAVIDRYIRVQGVTRATQYGYSLYEFQVFGADVPQILTQPASQTLTAGASATFSVVAGGTGPFTYQWMLNNLPIKGATAFTYTSAVLQSGDSGSGYTVNVTNASGTTVSSPAVVTVNAGAPTGPNLALHQPTTESGSQNDGSLGSGFAVDGDLTTRWSSDFVPTAWITVDLGAAKTVNQAVLKWEAAYATIYSIQVSTDGSTWSTVATKQNGQGGTENLTFAPVSARYVRMSGAQRATQYGYSLYEFEVYGPTAGSGTGTSTPPSITTQPANQSATVGSTATFTVAVAGTGPFTYQWLKSGTPITGATLSTYTTPSVALADNGSMFSVVIGDASGTPPLTSSAATLSVTSYTVVKGAISIDLVNNTHGAWSNDQVFFTVIGIDPSNGIRSYVNAAGQIVDFTTADTSAANHLTGPDGKPYGNYSFSLAQTATLKLPPLESARAFVSLGVPLYIGQPPPDSDGRITGFVGPVHDNPTDPNHNTHFDWYEFNYPQNSDGSTSIFINTTQVDEFGIPLVLDVWAANATFHQQVGISETIAQLDAEFAAEVPVQFQPPTLTDLFIYSPAKAGMPMFADPKNPSANGAFANYFDKVVQTAWTSYAIKPITINLAGRQYSGSASGPTLTFTEVNPAPQNVGETFVVQQPTTQDVLICAGPMNSGVDITGEPGSALAAMQQDEDAVQRQLQNQICSATNRGILLNSPTTWASASTYYGTSPANYYSQFWHKHSVGGFAYGFSYDDNNNQSTTISVGNPEHMTWTVGW